MGNFEKGSRETVRKKQIIWRSLMGVNLNRVRFLQDRVIEQESWNLLYEYSKKENWDLSAPIPVENIAEKYLGYQIELTNEGLFSEPTMLGGIIFDENTIQINGGIENQDGRYNFTVAHEIGHHTLHKTWLYAQRSQQKLFEDSEVQSILCREEGVKPRGEIQADKFAACLLMPEQLVKETFINIYKYPIDVTSHQICKEFGLPVDVEAKMIAEKVIEKGGFTNVSKIAMVNRLINLKLIEGVEYQKNETYEDMEFVD